MPDEEKKYEYGFRADGGSVIDRAFGIVPFETAEAAEHTGSKWWTTSLEIVRREVPGGVEWERVSYYSDEAP